MEKFDAIVIGAGQAGKPLASELARAGRRTALIEREHIGGTCINVGCTPTKTMVASARVAYLARRGGDFGVAAGAIRIDQSAVRARKRAIVESFRGGSQSRLERTANLSLVFGEARFAGPGSMSVELKAGGSRQLASDTIVINTGCRPSRPPLPGLDGVPWLDSTSVMELDSVPDHLLVLGGGYIALEFGQMFRRFGSRVTIVQRGERLLSREDPDVADEVARILRDDGLELLLAAETLGVAREDGGVCLRVRCGGAEREVSGTHLLVATGRAPNTERLGLDTAGIATDARGFVRVDETLATTAPGVWAAGDVNGGPAFTHVSYDDYRVLRDRLLRGVQATTRGRLVPWTVFIDPELGHVGLNESAARRARMQVKVAKLPMTSVARALEMDEARGFMKAVVDAATGRIVGFTVLGVNGGELLAVVQMAMMAGLPFTALREAVFVHPTLAESLNNLFSSFEE